MGMLKKVVERARGSKRRGHVVYNDDVFLVSFPKSGNTWLAFLLGNVLALKAGHSGEVNFFNVQDYIPEYDVDAFSLRPEGVGGLPRIIKSHLPCTPAYPKVVLVVRDPRDVMVSYFHYLKGLKRIPENSTISDVIRSEKYGIDAWVAHTRGWLERADAGRRVRVYRYEDFLADPLGRLSALFDVLGHPVPQEVLQEAVLRSAKDRMKALEKSSRSPDYPLSSSEFAFVRKGKSGEGREIPEADRRLIEDRAASLMDLLGYPRG